MNRFINAKSLIFLTVLSIPLYLIRFSFFAIPTNLLEILILLAFVFSVYEAGANINNFYQLYKNYICAILLILLGLSLSTLTNKGYIQGLGIIKGWFIFPLLFSFALLQSIKSKRELESILTSFYLSAFLVAAAGMLYFFNDNLTYDMRLKAFYLSPNYLAMFLSPGFIFGAWKIISLIKRGKAAFKDYDLLLFSLSLPVIFFSLFLTYSYAAWVSIIASFALLLLLKKTSHFNKSKVAAILICILFLAALTQLNNPKFSDFANFSDRSSFASRMMIWKASLEILKDNPVLGIGPGNFQSNYLEYQKYFPPYLEWAVPQPHNLYLAFWLQGGILGLAGFLYITAFWIKEAVRPVGNKKGGFSLVETALLGIMFYTLIHGIFDTTYWKNDLAVIFWMVLALGISARKMPDMIMP